MILTLMAVGLLSSTSIAEAPKSVLSLPFTEVSAQGGKIVIVGKDYRATAARLVISRDGQWLDMQGTDNEPVILTSQPGEQSNRMELSGKRIMYSPSQGTFRVEGAGRITGMKPRAK